MSRIGIDGFEQLVPEGIPKAGTVLLLVPPTEEKDQVAAQFLLEGLRGGEAAIVVASDAGIRDLVRRMGNLGFDADKAVALGRAIPVDWDRAAAPKNGNAGGLPGVEAALTAATASAKEFPAVRVIVDLSRALPQSLSSLSLEDLIAKLLVITKASGALSLFLAPRARGVTPAVVEAFDLVLDLRPLTPSGVQLAVVAIGGTPLPRSGMVLTLAEGRLVLDAAKRPAPPAAASVECPVCKSTIPAGAPECPVCKSPRPVRSPGEPEVLDYIEALGQRVGLPGAPLEPAPAGPPAPAPQAPAPPGKEGAPARPEPAPRGLTNGLAKKRKMAAPSAPQGRVNGLTSTIAAARRGMTNGLTNGNGFTNGLGAQRFVTESRKRVWRVYLIPIVAVSLLALPLFFSPELVTVNTFGIDGSFGEWADRVPLAPDASLPGSIDLTSAALRADAERLYGFLETRDPLLQGSPDGEATDSFYVFLDADGNPGTGYTAEGFGADLLVLIAGARGSVAVGTVSESPSGSDPSNWGAWAHVDGVLAAVGRGPEANRLEFSFLHPPGWDVVNLRSLFVSVSHSGRADTSGFSIAPGLVSLLVEEQSVVPESFAGSADLLELRLRTAEGTAHVTSIRVSARGTLPTSDLQAASLLDSAQNELANANQYANGFTFALSPPLAVPSTGVSLRVRAWVDIAAAGTLGLAIDKATGVLANASVSLVSLPQGRDLAYVGPIPSGITIDGAFAEWPGPLQDEPGEGSTGGNPNIDLAAFDSLRSGAGVGVYVQVAGRALGGALIPARNPAVPRAAALDSDRDGVPDGVEAPLGATLPFDFNNDNVSDADSHGDRDGDGNPEAPAGTDVWLNTTIPSWYPTPYAGRPVSLYLGPVQAPVARGEDTLRVFIDSDATPSTGYSTTVGAEWMVEVVGRHGVPTTKRLYNFTGTNPGHWSWSEEGTLDLVVGSRQLEVLASLSVAPVAGTQVVVDTRDWKGASDRSAVATRGLTRSFAGVSVDAGAYTADLPMDALGQEEFRLGTDLFTASWRLSGILAEADGALSSLPVAADPLAVTESSASYPIRVGGARGSLEYSFGPGTVKEQLVVHSPPMTPAGFTTIRMRFSLDLSEGASLIALVGIPGTGSFGEDGDYAIFTGNERAALLPRPFASDAAGQVTPCAYVLGSPGVLDIVCPAAAFSDARYPIAIDPSVVVTMSNNGTLGQAGEFLGYSVAIGDFNGDGYADLLAGAPFNDYGGADRGAAYIYYGPLTSSDDTPNVWIAGAEADGSRAGFSVAAGKFNGDVYWDALVSRVSSLAVTGNVSIYYGSASWSGLETTPDIQFAPPSSPKNFGWTVASGNLDNANNDDVIIAEPGRDNNGDVTADGVVYVYKSPFSSVETTSDFTLFPSTNASGQLGRGGIAVGPIDSDAYPDLVIGETFFSSKAGRVQFYKGISFASGSGNRWANATLNAQASIEEFGTSLSLGRVNGDSYADVAVGAPKKNSGSDGAVYVFYADSGGSGLTTGASPSLTIPSQSTGEQFGTAVVITDYNDDGTNDLIVGAPYADAGGTDRGRAYWFSNIVSDQTVDDTISGAQTTELLGIALASGKFSQDARTVIAIGAYLWDNGSNADAGRVAVATIPEASAIMVVVVSVVLPLLRRVIRRGRFRHRVLTQIPRNSPRDGSA